LSSLKTSDAATIKNGWWHCLAALVLRTHPIRRHPQLPVPSTLQRLDFLQAWSHHTCVPITRQHTPQVHDDELQGTHPAVLRVFAQHPHVPRCHLQPWHMVSASCRGRRCWGLRLVAVPCGASCEAGKGTRRMRRPNSIVVMDNGCSTVTVSHRARFT
jgi:hypothetical protein